MEEHSRARRLTATGVICELAKTKSQEHFLYGVQSKAILDLDVSLGGGGGDDDADDAEVERRLLSAIELQLVEYPEQLDKDKRAVRQGIAHLKEKIQRLRIMAEDVQKYDIKAYRSCVLDVENTLTDLTDSNQLQLGKLKCLHMDIVAQLPEPSDLLREETKVIQRRPPPIKVPQVRKNKGTGQWEEEDHHHQAAKTTTCDYKEVREFDRFLQLHGGHTGGWHDEQHSIFLSLRAKYRSNLSRIEEAFREILPGKKTSGDFWSKSSSF